MTHVARVTVDIDVGTLRAAQAALGTRNPSETVNAALRVVALGRFDVLSDIEGTPAEVEAGRFSTPCR